MAKDPAMLWYWSDWNSGTIILSRFLKGCYMDLLHAQFNSGHLSLEEIKTVLGSDFGTAWPALQKKFKADDAGKFFNERCEAEQIKRANFTASRRKNLESLHTETHMDTHTDKRMENANGVRDEFRTSIKKEQAEKASRETDLPEQIGPKPPNDDRYQPLTDEWFADIFNETYLDQLVMAYREHDIQDQLKKFKAKVIGSPADYIYGDNSRMRKAFEYQLRNTKSQKNKEFNGKPKASLADINKFRK